MVYKTPVRTSIAASCFLWLTLGWAGALPPQKSPLPPRMTGPAPVKKIDPPLGKLIITSPRQGDYMVAGRDFVIRWSAEGFLPEKCVSLAYRVGTVLGPYEINPRVCVNGYRWSVPDNMHGEQLTLVIRTLDQKITAISSPFPVLSAKPDLAFQTSTVVPTEPSNADRDKLKLSATIINREAGRAIPSQAQITFGPKNGNSSQLVSKIFDVPALDFGEQHTITLNWPPSVPLIPGGCSFQVDLDITHVVDEETEGNNHIDRYVLVQGLSNLVVCAKDRLEAITTKKARLKAIVKNTGEATSGLSVARWWIEGHGAESFDIPNLGPGQTHEIKREITWLTGGTDNYTIEVDMNNHVRELSETDDVKHGTIKRHVLGTPVEAFDNSPQCPEYGIP